MGIRIEQFIYTNIKQRGRGIRYSTIDLASLKTDFNKIMELFQQITPSLNIVFSKLNDDYYIYYQCKEVGFEGVGIENKKGRKGDIFIGLLIPLNIIEKLNYDFSLVHLLLSDEINWKNILNVIEEENSTLKPLNIEFNTDELTKKVINYLKYNSSDENIYFTKTKLKTNFNKIISNPEIINLMNYSLSLPKDIGKDIIFSTLDIYYNTINDDISSTRNIPSNLYYEQVSFLDNINKESYHILKNYPIHTKDVIKDEEDTQPINASSSSIKKEPINLKKILKISLYSSIFLFLGIVLSPFYQYYKLTSTYTKDITLENLTNYRELIDNNGFLLNSFTEISSKYQYERENLFVRNKKNILAFTHCDSKKLTLTKNTINEYRKDKDIRMLEAKHLDLNICILNLNIQKGKKYITPFLNIIELRLKKELDNESKVLIKLKELIVNIKKYRKLIQYKDSKYYNDSILYNIIYEMVYFRPIKKALKREEPDDVLELIQNYEKHTILLSYKEDIQKIKLLLNKKEVQIKIKVFSKKDRDINIEYLSIKNKELTQKMKSNHEYTLYLPWNEEAFIKINDIYIIQGRLLKSLNKEFTEESLLPFIKKDSFRVKLKTFEELRLFNLNEEDIQKYIK
ncbi:MAG TPA: hypothetical protein EYG89_01220 [Bacteroidia bacterium]|nr:hypothetical protein [Bacteroidia bacterium]